MTIGLLVLFTIAGFSWGLALSPIQKPVTKNFFKIQIPEVKGVSGMVKEAKKNMDLFDKPGNA